MKKPSGRQAGKPNGDAVTIGGYKGLALAICNMAAKDYARELKVLGVELPDVSQIPAVKFADIKEIVAEKYSHKMRNPRERHKTHNARIRNIRCKRRKT